MQRRHLLKSFLATPAALSLPTTKLFAAPEDYTGRFFVTLQVTGAWDVSSFCDPKVNQTGEPEINHWSRSNDILTAGNLTYAPFGNNNAFFQKYYRDILVVNGVDAQTNSHTTGITHNWSGRNSAGYPSLSALFSLLNAPDLPLSYINFGGYAETARLIRYTRLNDINSLISVLSPNAVTWNRELNYRDPQILSLVQQRQQERLNRLRQKDTLLPRQKYTLDAYYSARANAAPLEDFAAYIPPENELEQSVSANREVTSSLRTQAQMALLGFKSGVACSADLNLHGFDTHADHDALHSPLLAHLTDTIDYFWTYADSLGIADRITLMVASDFARTPFYNSGDGKDHWPIGSVMFMEQGADWGNRQLGATDEGQNAVDLNPDTLTPQNGGVRLYPKHVHHAIRQYLGINDSPLAQSFPLSNTELLPIFS